jgi:hypothetical protein
LWRLKKKNISDFYIGEREDEGSDKPTTSVINPDVEELSHNAIKYRRLTFRKSTDEINMNIGTGLCLNAYTKKKLKNISRIPDMGKKCYDFSGGIVICNNV